MSNLTNKPSVEILCPHCRKKIATQIGYYSDQRRPCVTRTRAVCCNIRDCEEKARWASGTYRFTLVRIESIGKIEDDDIRMALFEQLAQMTGNSPSKTGFLHAHHSQPV